MAAKKTNTGAKKAPAKKPATKKTTAKKPVEENAAPMEQESIKQVVAEIMDLTPEPKEEPKPVAHVEKKPVEKKVEKKAVTTAKPTVKKTVVARPDRQLTNMLEKRKAFTGPKDQLPTFLL